MGENYFNSSTFKIHNKVDKEEVNLLENSPTSDTSIAGINTGRENVQHIKLDKTRSLDNYIITNEIAPSRPALEYTNRKIELNQQC